MAAAVCAGPHTADRGGSRGVAAAHGAAARHCRQAESWANRSALAGEFGEVSAGVSVEGGRLDVFGGARALNPKAEGRNPKEGRSPKAEIAEPPHGQRGSIA